MNQSFKRRTVRVIGIRDETPDAYTLFLGHPPGEILGYFPGQYITLILDIDGEEHRRAYSLSSAPGQDQYLAITIKRVKGGLVSNFLREQICEGDAVEILPPMGDFAIKPSVDRSRHYLFFAAGSGITPIMSMTKAVLKEEPLSRVSLWYGNRTDDSIIFRQDLEKLQGSFPERLDLKMYLSKPSPEWKGRIGWVNFDTAYQEILELFMVDEYRKKYFICGPSAMMAEVYEALEKHAVHPTDIHTEYFSAPLREETPEEEEAKAPPEFVDRKIRITLDGQTREIEVKAGGDILSAAVEAGLDPPYACRSGLCISCRAQKKSGEVYMNEWIGLSEEEIAQGLVLTCQAQPISDDVEIDFDA